jgi:large subunit ribosomal protein L5
MMNLNDRYKQEAVPFLCKSFGIKNVHEVPKIKKITLSMGVGSHATDKAYLDACKLILSILSGQKPLETFAKKAIANFKTRAGQSSGFYVTIRNHRAFNFLTKLVYVAIPRLFDFNGFNKSMFDEKGNLSIGLADVSVFIEIPPDIINNSKIGMNISISIDSQSKDHAVGLMESLDVPIKKTN